MTHVTVDHWTQDKLFEITSDEPVRSIAIERVTMEEKHFAHLAKLKQLTHISMSCSDFAAVQTLSAALPSCVIEFAGDRDDVGTGGERQFAGPIHDKLKTSFDGLMEAIARHGWAQTFVFKPPVETPSSLAAAEHFLGYPLHDEICAWWSLQGGTDEDAAQILLAYPFFPTILPAACVESETGKVYKMVPIAGSDGYDIMFDIEMGGLRYSNHDGRLTDCFFPSIAAWLDAIANEIRAGNLKEDGDDFEFENSSKVLPEMEYEAGFDLCFGPCY